MKQIELKTLLIRSIKELNNLGISSAVLDAKLLLEKSLDKDSVFVYTNPSRPITNAEYSKFRRYIRRRKTGEPIAYILGHKEFYGLDFLVNKNVLVPRPETEWLVEGALEFINSNIEYRISKQIQNKKKAQKVSDFGFRISDFKILDLGTGSGNIVISLSKMLTRLNADSLASFYATDISQKALRIAKKNAKHLLFEAESRELLSSKSSRLRSNNINFYKSDLFSNPRLPKKFDLITANLPYVPKETERECKRARERKLGITQQNYSTLVKNPISFEPQEAIFADDNGSAIIKKFLLEAKNRINKGGLILIELDPRNALQLLKIAKLNYPDTTIELIKDLAQKNRYIKIAN